MNFRHPLIIVSVSAVLITAVCVSAILASYSAEQIRVEKRNQVLELREASRGFISTVNQSLMKSLVSVYEHELLTPESLASLEASEFTAIGSFTQDASSRWIDDWFVSRSPQIERGWFAKVERQVLLNEVRAGELTWARLTTDNEQVLFAVLSRVQVKTADALKTKIVAAISSQALLTPINLVSKGEATQIFAVDREGYTYSYPEAQYVGAKIDTHPVVKALIDDVARPEVSDYSNLDGAPIFGATAWVPDSNLAVVVTTPKVTTRHLLAQFFTHSLIVVLALIAMVIVGLAFILARDGRERNLLLQNLELLQKPREEKAATVVKGDAGVVAGADLNSATHLAVKEIVKAIADYMRMPLTAILGQLQIADHQDSLSTIKETLRPSIDEARRIRDFIESLCNEVQLAELKREVVEILPVINQVMAACKGLITKYDIHVEENFQTDFDVRADFERVRSSLQSFLLFAIEYIGASSVEDKRLVVHLERLAGLGQIQIEAYGRPLTAEGKRQFFVPFKTKLQSGTQFGLDLVVAQARIDEMQGEVFVENTGENGFRIVLRFATAMKVTADQLAPINEISDSPLKTLQESSREESESPAAAEGPSSPLNSASPVAPATTFALAKEAAAAAAIFADDETENNFQIRKPKLRLEL